MNILIASVAAFNLVCTGTQTTKSLMTDKSQPYSAVYRIDLDGGKWCEGECKALHPIAHILPTQLQLQSDKVDSPSERSTTSNMIDRETGAHTILATFSSPRDRAYAVMIQWAGQCEKSAFTGFPKFETKF
jgi:hypothetical protein